MSIENQCFLDYVDGGDNDKVCFLSLEHMADLNKNPASER